MAYSVIKDRPAQGRWLNAASAAAVDWLNATPEATVQRTYAIGYGDWLIQAAYGVARAPWELVADWGRELRFEDSEYKRGQANAASDAYRGLMRLLGVIDN